MKHKGIYYLVGIAVIAIYVWTVVLGNDPLQPAIASKILRFHVLANSDEVSDQSVKEKVRDAVGGYLQPLLEDAESLEETKLIVETNMDEIIEIAESTLNMYGYDYSVTATIANVDFPEKSYGSYTFPKGNYEALQIVIGEGKGQNWWCVLYPNMCFKGSVFEVIEEEAEQSLKEVLTPWEYADVFDSGKVELRFKFLEYFVKRG
jgi:stage II sporulation protein R